MLDFITLKNRGTDYLVNAIRFEEHNGADIASYFDGLGYSLTEKELFGNDGRVFSFGTWFIEVTHTDPSKHNWSRYTESELFQQYSPLPGFDLPGYLGPLKTEKYQAFHDPSRNIVEAVRLTRENLRAVSQYWQNVELLSRERLMITIPSGLRIVVTPGDWVYSSVDGETARGTNNEQFIQSYEDLKKEKTMDIIKMVDRQDPSKVIEAVRFTEENGVEIAEYWDNLEYDAEEAMLYKKGDHVPWQPGRWVVSEVDSETAFFQAEETLLAAFAPLPGNVVTPDLGFSMCPTDLPEYADNVRFLHQPKSELVYQDLDPLQARLLLSAIYGKKMPDGSLGSIEYVEKIQRGEAELPQVDINDVVTDVSEDGYMMTGKVGPETARRMGFVSEEIEALMRRELNQIKHAIIGDNGIGKIEIDRREWTDGLEPQGVADGYFVSADPVSGGTLAYYKVNEDGSISAAGSEEVNAKSSAYQCSLQELVCKFHEAFSHPAPKKPTRMPHERAILRTKMIQEELDEFDEASAKRDFVEQYDALLDILVLAYGGLVEMGVDATPGFVEVMRANMSKLGADGKPIISRGEELDGYPTGKILKGPDYAKPDLFKVLVDLGWVPTLKEFWAHYPEEFPNHQYYTHSIVEQLRKNALRDDVSEELKLQWGITSMPSPKPHGLYFGPES